MKISKDDDNIVENEITAINVIADDATQDHIAEMILHKLDKPKPHLANYLYEEDGKLKTGTTTVMR